MDCVEFFVSAVAQSSERVHGGFQRGWLGSLRPRKLKLTHAQSPVLELRRNMQLGKVFFLPDGLSVIVEVRPTEIKPGKTKFKAKCCQAEMSPRLNPYTMVLLTSSIFCL